MRLYPELAERRSRQIVRDLLVLLALMLFALLAWAVRAAVMSLTAISEGFTDSASGAQDTWNGVGDALAGIPLLGDDIQRAVEDLSSATFGNAAQTGQTITDAVTLAANVLAFVSFTAPVAVLLVLWLPRRLDRARAWDAAHRVLSAVPTPPAYVGGGAVALPPPAAPALGAPAPPATADLAAVDRHDTVALPWSSPAQGAPAHPGGPVVSFPPDELLALRALCHLPFEDLVTFSPRPFEAFAAGDYAPLVAALYAHEGLVPPGWSTRA